MSDPVLAYLETESPAILERLLALVRIPSVSTDPSYEQGMAAARETLLARLRDMGLSQVQTLEAGGHPAVYGQWLAGKNRPTVLVYGHYDVQPPDPLDKWHSPPFEPEIRRGRIYGRGVSDDKGPSSIALETIAAFLRLKGVCRSTSKSSSKEKRNLAAPALQRCFAIMANSSGPTRYSRPTVQVGDRI